MVQSLLGVYQCKPSSSLGQLEEDTLDFTKVLCLMASVSGQPMLQLWQLTVKPAVIYFSFQQPGAVMNRVSPVSDPAVRMSKKE